MFSTSEKRWICVRAVAAIVGALFIELVLFNLPSIATLTAGGGCIFMPIR